MICKNCQKFVTYEWLECPNCGYLNSTEDIEKLIAQFKIYFNEKEYVKCRVILEKCLKYTKLSSKEEVFKRQLEKINLLIKKSGQAESKSIKDIKPVPSGSYIRDQMLFKSGTEEDRLSGKQRYVKHNNFIIFFSIALSVVIILYYSICLKDGNNDYSGDSEYIPPVVKKITPSDEPRNYIEPRNYTESNKIQEIVQSSVLITPKKGVLKIDGIPVENNIEIKGMNREIISDSNASAFFKTDICYAYLGEKSHLILEKVAQKGSMKIVELNLKKGNVFCDVDKLASNDIFEIKTFTLAAGIRGTKFQVKILDKDKTAVYCLTGKIQVNDNRGKTAELISGFGVQADANGLKKVLKLSASEKMELENLNKFISDRKSGVELEINNLDSSVKYDSDTEDSFKQSGDNVPADKTAIIEKLMRRQNDFNLLPKRGVSSGETEKSISLKSKVSNSAENKAVEEPIETKTPVANSDSAAAVKTAVVKTDAKKQVHSEESGIVEFVKTKYSEKFGDSADTQIIRDKEKFNKTGIDKIKKKGNPKNFYNEMNKEAIEKFGESEVKSQINKLEKEK